jgi:predicted nucleic acid-binding protein
LNSILTVASVWNVILKQVSISKLKLAGKPIPENDIWIAALSMQHNIPLVTSDSHFRHIKDLKLLNW